MTTDGALAVGNLEAEIAQAERQLRQRPDDVRRAGALVDRLLTRAQYAGRLADLDRALAVGDAAVTRSPNSGDAHLLRARGLAAFHRFASALDELNTADGLLPPRDPARDQVLRARVVIWQATGDVDKALPYLHAWRRDRPDLTTYGAEAAAYADKREVATASALYDQAKRHYSDVSPFAVAWVEFQEAHLWEIAGRWDRAWPLYASAHARLPAYAAAAGHLATLLAAFGDPERQQQAAALLEAVVARSDGPEDVGQLAALYRQNDRDAEGGRPARRGATSV